MGRLLSEQESSPLERSDFDLDEIESAGKAKVAYDGWVEIEDVFPTDKGYVISYTRNELENCTAVDDIKKLR